jgi:hypothetical protein
MITSIQLMQFLFLIFLILYAATSDKGLLNAYIKNELGLFQAAILFISLVSPFLLWVIIINL